MNTPPQNRLYFLIKDPHWTFLWWQLTAESVDQAYHRLRRSDQLPQFVLRIFDVTGFRPSTPNGAPFFDVAVHGYTDHWYLNLPQAGRTYVAEVGFRLQSAFVALAWSNELTLPRDSASERTDETWSVLHV